MQDLRNSPSFISQHFDKEITQGVYEIIQFGSALPDEMVAAAVHMASRACSPQQMAQAANGEDRKILARSNEAMTEMLDSCFDRYPVLAARFTFDAGRSQTEHPECS